MMIVSMGTLETGFVMTVLYAMAESIQYSALAQSTVHASPLVLGVLVVILA